MLVVGGLCRRMLLRDDATCGAGKVHRLLRVPPTGCRRTFYREHPIVDRTLLRFGVAHAPLVERSLRPSRPSFARCWRLFRQINQTRQEAAFCRPCKPLAFASADPSFGGPGWPPFWAWNRNAAGGCVLSAMQTLGVCIGRPKLRRARMAAEALKQDVRAWASEGGSLAQATEHPSGLS